MRGTKCPRSPKEGKHLQPKTKTSQRQNYLSWASRMGGNLPDQDTGDAPYNFLQLHVNLQLSQNKKFNF